MRCAGTILVPLMRWFPYPSPLPFQQPISESPPPAPLVTTLSESRRFFRSGPVGAHLEAAYAGRRQEPVLPEETWPNSLCRGRYHRYPFSGPALTAAQPSFLPASRSQNPLSFSRSRRGGLFAKTAQGGGVTISARGGRHPQGGCCQEYLLRSVTAGDKAHRSRCDKLSP